MQGAVYQMLAHGVSTGGLFLVVGMLSDRRHTRLISEFGGLKAVMPRLTAAFMIITLASIGLPGLNGFVGEFLILLGAFRWDPRYVVGAGLGVILSAVYMLWMFQRVYYGEVTHEENASLPDLQPREWAAVLPLCAMAIVMGVFPMLFLKPMEPSVQQLVQRAQSVQSFQVRSFGSFEPFGSFGAFRSFVTFERYRSERERPERSEQSERSERPERSAGTER
jgi:NADH-quinone oxidoreductase subunit M